MSLDLLAKGRQYGVTVSEWIESVPRELPVDGVGMWQIIPAGRYEFMLTGDDLAKTVALVLDPSFGDQLPWLKKRPYGSFRARLTAR